ncbi:nuclear transport factor 2 family protein [Synechococcus sp. PCC 7336]|uniref:nuclear transport factor 2 family protein n=1 Tax=Synechococcus sp. PCC 7336 TaxID=195250 RepID=UPI001930D7F2|nr:SgcJ/EcaC family oxidoreductase [Synechococcus sp. PCC 7336]
MAKCTAASPRITSCLLAGCLLFHLAATAQARSLPAIALPLSQAVSQLSGKVIEPPSKQILSAIQLARAAWLEADADAFARLFATSGEFVVPGERWVGPAAIRKAAASYFEQYSVLAIDLQSTLVEGNRAAVEWTWVDIEKATGRRNSAEDAIAIDFQNSKIQRWREYIDTQTPMQQQDGG